MVPHRYISWLFLPQRTQLFDPGGVRDGVQGGYETWITVTPGQGAEQHLGKVLPQVGSSWVLNQVHLGQAVTGTQVRRRGVGSVPRPHLQPQDNAQSWNHPPDRGSTPCLRKHTGLPDPLPTLMIWPWLARRSSSIRFWLSQPLCSAHAGWCPHHSVVTAKNPPRPWQQEFPVCEGAALVE